MVCQGDRYNLAFDPMSKFWEESAVDLSPGVFSLYVRDFWCLSTRFQKDIWNRLVFLAHLLRRSFVLSQLSSWFHLGILRLSWSECCFPALRTEPIALSRYEQVTQALQTMDLEARYLILLQLSWVQPYVSHVNIIWIHNGGSFDHWKRKLRTPTRSEEEHMKNIRFARDFFSY